MFSTHFRDRKCWKSLRKIAEDYRIGLPHPNPSPFCMEWKRVLLVAVRYGRLPKVGVARRAWQKVFVVNISLLP